MRARLATPLRLRAKGEAGTSPIRSRAMCKVRCADCGFLEAREVQTRQVAEVEPQMRSDWRQSPTSRSNGFVYIDRPLCFANVPEFDTELGAFGDSSVGRPEILLKADAVIHRERECGAFTKWQPGHTPKEHQEMLLNAETIERQERYRIEQVERDHVYQEEQRQKDRDAQERRDKEQRDWQAEQKRIDDARQQASKEADRKWQDSCNKWNRIWQIALALAALLVTSAGVWMGLRKYSSIDNPVPVPVIEKTVPADTPKSK